MKKHEVIVELWAFQEGKERPVATAEEEETDLDEIYYYGQNECQPVEGCASVSVGDVICLHDGSRHLVLGNGFLRLDAAAYERYIKLAPLEKTLMAMVLPDGSAENSDIHFEGFAGVCCGAANPHVTRSVDAVTCFKCLKMGESDERFQKRSRPKGVKS